MLNISVLIMVLFLMKRKISMIRIIIVAASLSLISVFLLSSYYVLIKVLINMIAVKIVINSKNIDRIFEGTILEYIVSYAISKIFWTIIYIYRHGGVVCIVSVSIVAIVCIIYQVTKMSEDKNNIYRVQINNCGIGVDMKALYDTGNQLLEPISGKPVSIVESDIYKQIVRLENPEKYKVIPYHTIGEEHGILEGNQIDKITILKKGENIIYEEVIIACYEGKLSTDGSFQMILNRDLL